MLLTNDLSAVTQEVERLAKRVKDLEGQVQSLETQVDEYQNLYVTSSQLITPVHAQEVLAVIQEILLNLVGAQSFDVSLTNDKYQLVSIITGERPGPASEAELNAWRDIQSDVLVSGQAVYKPEPLMAVLPLFSNGKCMGVLSIFHLLPQKNHAFTELDMGVLDFLSQHGGRAFECASLFEQRTAAITQCLKVLSSTKTG